MYGLTLIVEKLRFKKYRKQISVSRLREKGMVERRKKSNMAGKKDRDRKREKRERDGQWGKNERQRNREKEWQRKRDKEKEKDKMWKENLDERKKT